MATRVIERDQSWCRSQLIEFFSENGYQVEEVHAVKSMLQGEYAKARKQGMLYRPLFRAEVVQVLNKVTQVTLSFPMRWGSETILAILLTCITLGSLPILLGFFSKAIWSSSYLWSLFIGIFIAWNIFWALRLVYLAEAVDKHCRRLEKLVWERIDPSGTASHEIREPNPSFLGLLGALKWIPLALVAILGLLLFSDIWYPVFGPDRMPTMKLACIAILPSLTLLAIFAGWVKCSYSLPHRYHWKVRFGLVYMIWWLIVCLPGMSLFGWALLRSTLILNFDVDLDNISLLVPLLVPALLGLIVAHGFLIWILIRMLHSKKYDKDTLARFSPPSTRYEYLSEQNTDYRMQSLIKRYRLWTWALFLFMAAIWFIDGGYLAVTFFLSVTGIFGVDWAFDSAVYWPVIIPAKEFSMAIQTLTLTSLAGIPVAATISRMLLERLNLHRKTRFAYEIAESDEKLGLPSAPISELKQKLKAEKLQVALVPVSDINVQVERTATFRNEYLLWVSVGARSYLSSEELRALLFHECGHAVLLRRMWWREFIAIITPWGPRFLDLNEDLYDHEHKADIYAVNRTGDVEPLLSALKKVEKQQKSFAGNGGSEEGTDRVKSFLSESRILWNLGWTAYLYPDIDQRIRWLEERQQTGRNP